MNELLDYVSVVKNQFIVVSNTNYNKKILQIKEKVKDTKDYYSKNDGVFAYHGYQSFKEGEVTADIAHEIGIKLVE